LTLILGILAVVIGAVLLWAPLTTQINTYLTLITVLGIYWLVLGVLDIVHAFADHTNWGWKLFMGIVSILAGGYVVAYPLAAAVYLPAVFALILGIWGIIYGIAALVMAFRGAGWAAGILGALAIFFGAVLVANWSAPGVGLTFVYVAAIGGLIGGVALIVHAFQRRSSSGSAMPA